MLVPDSSSNFFAARNFMQQQRRRRRFAFDFGLFLVLFSLFSSPFCDGKLL